MAKKQPLRERFQQLAGLKPLYEAEYGKYFGGRTKGGDPRRPKDIEFDNAQAHSALYDTVKTAELFCQIFNAFEFAPIPKN